MNLSLLCFVISIAYRGKGGLFHEAWGWGDTVSHIAGGLLVGVALGAYTEQWSYIPAFVALWVVFTKPSTAWFLDLCGGFSVSAYLKSILRALLIAPLFGLTYYLGNGSLCFSLGILFIPSLYVIGGAVNRKWSKIDPVEFAEWSMGITGLAIAGLYAT